MAKKQDERIVVRSTDDIEIFGAHKTREQIKAEEKARKQAEREALRRELAARRAAAKKDGSAGRFDMWTVVIVLVVIVALAGCMLWASFARSAEADKFERDESRDGWLASQVDENPEKALKGAASAAYFTRGGYLAVNINLTNDADTDQLFQGVEVIIINGEEQIVAQGYAEVPNEFIVPAQGTDTYTLYISPEHILLKEDTLQSAAIDVKVTATTVTK